MNKITLILALILLTFNAHAAHEFPTAGAEMEIIKSRGEFNTVESVVLETTEQLNSSKPTGMILSFQRDDFFPSEVTQREIKLEIVDSVDLGCGSVEYLAELRPTSELVAARQVKTAYFDINKPTHAAARPLLQIVLTDHTERFCKDKKEYLWEATVTMGFGRHKGSYLKIGGNPERY